MQDLYHQPYPYLTSVFGFTERPTWPLLKAYSQIEANDGGKPPQCRAAPARRGRGRGMVLLPKLSACTGGGDTSSVGRPASMKLLPKLLARARGMWALAQTHTLEIFGCLLASRWAVLEACIPCTGIACASHPCRRSVLCVATRYARSCHLHYETSHDHTQMHLPTKYIQQNMKCTPCYQKRDNLLAHQLTQDVERKALGVRSAKRAALQAKLRKSNTLPDATTTGRAARSSH